MSRGKWLALLFFGFLGVALYGSLVPFNYRSLPTDEALQRWRTIPLLDQPLQSRADFVANILLFIPLGYCLTGALAANRSPGVGMLVAPMVAGGLFALSMVIEFTQIYFPPRTVSSNDIIAESVGGVIGTAVWLTFGNAIADYVRDLWRSWGGRSWAGRLLPGYLALLVLIHVMPLDLTIRPGELLDKYQEGRVILVPFTTEFDSTADLLAKHTWNVLYFLPLGVLLARMPGATPNGVWNAAGFGLLAAAGIEMLQLFVYTRYFDTTDIITGTAAAAVGWYLAGVSGPMSVTPVTPGPRRNDPRPYVCGLAIVGWSMITAAIFCYPYDVVTEPTVVKERLEMVNVVPFQDLYWGSEYHAFDQILQKTLLFLPLGVILAWGRRGRGGYGMPVIAGGLGLLIAGGIEAGQVLTPGHYPSATDATIGATAAMLGYVLAAPVFAGDPSREARFAR